MLKRWRDCDRLIVCLGLFGWGLREPDGELQVGARPRAAGASVASMVARMVD